MSKIEELRFLTPALAEECVKAAGSPCYAYDLATLQTQAKAALEFPNAYGLTVRFAMKSCPNGAILKLFHSMGLHFDCSSIHEVKRCMAVGVPAEKCSLSSQQLDEGFETYVAQGLKINCCSLLQLEKFCAKCPGKDLGLRFNPGVGSGGTGKTNVGGPSSSFGIWHENAAKCAEMAAAAGCKVVRVHTHIGSGSDPAVWRSATTLSINLCSLFPDVATLNLGGGYKVGRMLTDKGTTLATDCAVVKDVFTGAPLSLSPPSKDPCRHSLHGYFSLPPPPFVPPLIHLESDNTEPLSHSHVECGSTRREPDAPPLAEFTAKDGRKLHLEIEPGTYLSANSGALVCTVHDIVKTGTDQVLSASKRHTWREA